jgi:hypothetical protein
MLALFGPLAFNIRPCSVENACYFQGRGKKHVRLRRVARVGGGGRPYFQMAERRADCPSEPPTQPSSAFDSPRRALL